MAKYYIRPRRDDDPKKCTGPFDLAQLKDQAARRLFTKELHECSEDRINWISAKEIWPQLFPKTTKPLNSTSQPSSASSSEIEPAQTEVFQLAKPEPAVQEAQVWYWTSDDQQQGPVSFSELQQLAAAGQLLPTDRVWCPRYGDEWVEAQSNQELFLVVDDPPRSGRPAKVTAGSQKTPPLAIASFVLGLLGIFPCTCWLFNILAVVFGHIALSQFRNSKEFANGNKWMAITGIVLGYVGIALSLVVTMLYLVLVSQH